MKVSTAGESPATVAEYRYDGRNFLIRKTVAAAPAATYDYYHNEQWQVIEERKDGEVYAQYVWDLRYIDAPVVRWRDSDDDEQHTLDETLYYTTDANMNVTAVIDRSTGLPAERYSYDPYGKPAIHNADWSGQVAWESSRWNEVLYCGYRYDWETGNYHVRNRHYHPALAGLCPVIRRKLARACMPTVMVIRARGRTHPGRIGAGGWISGVGRGHCPAQAAHGLGSV